MPLQSGVERMQLSSLKANHHSCKPFTWSMYAHWCGINYDNHLLLVLQNLLSYDKLIEQRECNPALSLATETCARPHNNIIYQRFVCGVSQDHYRNSLLESLSAGFRQAFTRLINHSIFRLSLKSAFPFYQTGGSWFRSLHSVGMPMISI